LWNWSVLSVAILSSQFLSQFSDPERKDLLGAIIYSGRLLPDKIESLTGWDSRTQLEPRLKEYSDKSGRELITLFCKNLIASVGKRSFCESENAQRREMSDVELVSLVESYLEKVLFPVMDALKTGLFKTRA
jgi:hypothetical protein